MRTTSLIFLSFLALIFIIFNRYQLKQTRKMVVKVQNGEKKNKLISKWIKKAEELNKSEYTKYMIFNHGIMASFAQLAIGAVVDIFLFNNELAHDDLLFFLTMMLVINTINAFIIARRIWSMTHEQKSNAQY